MDADKFLKNISVVSTEEAEAADFVVCMRSEATTKHHFTDNVFTNCSKCGHEIYHRPHAPKAPAKICMNCVIEMAREQEG